MKLIDMAGKAFGRLTVLSRASNAGKETRWLCRCECGNETVAHGTHLRSGHTASCGCLVREQTARNFTIHGQSHTKLHRVLRSMRQRCSNPKDKGYEFYGARGIKVCDEWQADAAAFIEWAHANGYREGLTIERLDNDGDYSPGNCEFVDRFSQANNKRNNRRHQYHGKSLTLAQLARLSGRCPETIANRLDVQGMTVEEAVETPRKNNGGRRRAS